MINKKTKEVQTIYLFIDRHVRQIKEEGWPAVRRKARTAVIISIKLPIYLIGFTFAVPVVLFVRLIRFWVLIRFGPVSSGVIGHSVLDPEYYLCERELDKSKTIDCFYFHSGNPPPNEQWTIMVQRHLKISPFFWYLDRTNRLISGGEKHYKRPGVTGSRDLKGYFAITKPHIKFLSEEDVRGRQFLENLGMQSSDRFVSLLVRDSAYKEKYQNWGKRDWSYHNYRDSDIDTYEKVALELANKGYWVLRMGKAVHKPFKANHTRILDYANYGYRSDFLDIWLMANCFFTISTGTGLDAVSSVFRRPIVYVNFTSVGYCIPGSTKNIHLFKYLKWESTGNYLSLNEQIDSGSIHFLRTNDFVENGIEIVDNTAQEIRDATLEMEMRLSNTWKENAFDLELQNRFWNILKEWKDYHKYHGKIQARISTNFLRKNHKWFLK